MHQFLFYVGDFPIRSYGVILSLSIFLATGVGYFMAKADGRGYEKFIIDTGSDCWARGFGTYFFSTGIIIKIISTKF